MSDVNKETFKTENRFLITSVSSPEASNEENESLIADRDGKKENEVDDSGPEEYIPELLNIESAYDDDQKSEKHSDSENESEVTEDDDDQRDSDTESEESEVGELIANIFGESDDEGEFEGFNAEDIGNGETAKTTAKPKIEKKKRATIVSDSEEEEEKIEKENYNEKVGVIYDLGMEEIAKKKKKIDSDDSDIDDDKKLRNNYSFIFGEDYISDFDLMMAKKKEENSKRRKRKDVDFISDSDDLIADIIAQMRQAAEEDRELNKQKKTATKKLKILPMIISQLKKQDLKMAFLDQGVLNVVAQWLSPLPDRSLSHLNIREGMLKLLLDISPFDQSFLKSSGVGKAVMYLFKHPKETKENRERARRLITEWARPIFNVTTNYYSLTKEEREQRYYDHVPKKQKKRPSIAAEEPTKPKRDIGKDLMDEQKTLGPGDKGWIPRARVPMPSAKDYVNRPKWNVETEFSRGPSKKPLNRIEKHMRSLQDKKKLSKIQQAITISIEGRKMAI